MALFLISELSEKQKPYSFRLLLQINYLGEEVCDLFLLASSILCLLGQFLRDAGNLYVGVPFDQETTITRNRDNGFFVVCTRKKKKSLLQDRGRSGEGAWRWAWRESPHLPQWAWSVLRRNQPLAVAPRVSMGASPHCLESPPQRKSGRLWRSARRHHTKQMATLTNSTCSIQTHHQWQGLLLHFVLERNYCVHNTIPLGVFSPYSEP